MEWSPPERQQRAHLVSEIDACGGLRSATLSHAIVLRLSAAPDFRAGLPPPRNAGSLLVRHLFHAIGFDETRLCRWTIEHKLVQALLLDHYCPGLVPATRGVGRELAGRSRWEAREQIENWRTRDCVIKAAFSEGSGEHGRLDQCAAVLAAIERREFGSACPETVSHERFILQERISIRNEYRVHSLEDRIVPDLTFYRYASAAIGAGERHAANEFVRSLLVRLPDALVKDSLHAWDVAIDDSGRWHVIELNPAGRHLRYKPGFHCSGFFQIPPLAPIALPALLRFVSRRYVVPVDVVLDVHDETMEERAAYSWAAAANESASSTPTVEPANADAPVSPPQIAAADRQRIREWNRTDRAYPIQESVPTLFEAQVRARSDAVAVVGDDGTVTYGALNRRASRLAWYLRRADARPEMRVGICMTRNTDLVAALLAVLKVGAAYVPLVADGADDRLRRIMRDVEIGVCLTDTITDGPMSQSGVPTLNLDGLSTAVSAGCECNLQRPVYPDALAYIVHTSGSTGSPKPVAIPHAALLNVLWHMIDALELRDHDRWLAVTPLSFDIAALEIFAPLICGGQLWMAGTMDVADGTVLRRRLSASGATVMQATPVTWQLLIGAGWIGSSRFRALTGGEALPPALARQLADRAGVTWNLYGPSETTIWSSAWIVDRERPTVAIGLPIANTQMYVLDEAMNLQPPGVSGELYIGGVGLARGYLGQPGVTATRFVADPYSTRPGSRLYRTGDLARWRAGALEFLGRTDNQVKIRGVRVECDAIEHVLKEHPGVREVAVVARPDDNGLSRLVAFIARDPADESDTCAALQAFLRARLAPSMVPSVFVDIDHLPRTPHGKIDRQSLVVPESAQRRPPRARAEPETPTEDQVAAIWSAVLGLETVGIDEEFLDLGGDSVSAIRCVNRIRELFKVDVPLTVLLVEASSVRRLAALIEECDPSFP